jgi:serine/threonine protein kinase
VQRPVPFGKYLLLERISVGGMAEVFKAKSFGVKGFEKIIAIKRILPHLAEDAHFVEMFVSEAKVAVQLSHPGIGQIYDLGKVDEDHYIAMEYISGKDLLALHNHLRRIRTLLPVELTAYVGAQIARALDYAHEKRDAHGEPMHIVHRDVSPQNVLVSYDGAVKVIDFGVAKARVSKAPETQAGTLKGKFGYMSPEQIEGAEIDHRSDIFAIGTVIHELLTSKRLFLGENEFATLEQVRQANVPPAGERNPDVDDALDAILARALARDREERYQRAGDLADALVRWAQARGARWSQQPVSEWMREQFVDDIAREKARHELYAQITGLDDEAQAGNGRADEAEDPLWEPMLESMELSQAGPDTVDLDGPPDDATIPLDRDGPLALPPASFSAQPTPPPARPPEPDAILIPAPEPDEPTGGLPMRELLAAAALVLVVVIGGLVAYSSLDPAASTRASASLVIRVTPADQLNVYVDNKRVATESPYLAAELEPSTYMVRVERTGFRTLRRQVVLTAGAVEELQLSLEPLRVEPAKVRLVVDPPDSEVFLAEESFVANNRRGYLELPGGKPVPIEIRRTGYLPYVGEVNATPGVSQTLRYNLLPTPGSILVDSEPSATVWVDAEKKGRTPLTIGDLDVTRAWTVRVERSGYTPWSYTVEFGEKRHVSLTPRLVRR